MLDALKQLFICFFEPKTFDLFKVLTYKIYSNNHLKNLILICNIKNQNKNLKQLKKPNFIYFLSINQLIN